MGVIYLKQGGELTPMDERPYDAEALLQELLASHPGLLAGGRGDDEGRWLLIQREAGITDQDAGSDRWSLDHLFVDREGVPTLVEVKRSTDTRLRREVVGQMLDYAANATSFWSRDHLRAAFERRFADESESTAAVSEFTGDPTVERFWATVSDNLEARRLRLVFVADRIPDELQRVIEFLNEQMEHTEVLALEVRQYVERGGSRTTLVPQLIGNTARAQEVKRRPSRDKYAPEDARAQVLAHQPGNVAQRTIALYDALLASGARESFGTASITLWLGEDAGRPVNPSIWPTYTEPVAIDFRHIRTKRAREDLESLAAALSSIPGLAELVADARERDFNVWMKCGPVVQSDSALEAFLQVVLAESSAREVR